MKLIYSLLLILCFNNLFSQTGEVIYIATPTKDDSKSQRLKERNEEVRLMSFSLKFNNEQSFFKKNKNVPIKKDRSAIASILLGSNVDLFQYSKQKKVIYISNINNETYRVADTTKMNNWELYSISKMIENYKCYKASLTLFNERAQKNYTIIAWYAPEIPFQYGPSGYGGLPGLILELKNKNGYIFTPEKISLNKKSIKIPKLEKAKEISIKQKLILKRKERKVTED